LPLKTGMSRSKNGLLNDRLTKWNSAASMDCSQCIADNVAGNGELENGIAGSHHGRKFG
jgi:hypothetical protein